MLNIQRQTKRFIQVTAYHSDMGTELIISQQAEELQKAPQLLQSLDMRLQKAEAHYNAILSKVENAELTPALDNELMTSINAYKTALTDFNTQRSPITKRLQDIVKLFTEKENKLKGFIDNLQVYRNKFAKMQAEEIERQRREAEVIRLKEKELIDLKNAMYLELQSFIQDKIDTLKKGIIKSLETVTEENKDEKFPRLQAMTTTMSEKEYSTFKTSLISSFGHDIAAIRESVVQSYKDEMRSHYEAEITLYKQEAIFMFNQIVTASKEEKEATIKVASEEIAIESNAAKEIAEVQANASKEAEMAELNFNAVAVDSEMPETRTGFEIVVSNNSAYPALVAYWFSICYKDFTGDILKKTVASMITDLEKHAHKTGEKLQNSNITYQTIYKAVNRK